MSRTGRGTAHHRLLGASGVVTAGPEVKACCAGSCGVDLGLSKAGSAGALRRKSVASNADEVFDRDTTEDSEPWHGTLPLLPAAFYITLLMSFGLHLVLTDIKRKGGVVHRGMWGYVVHRNSWEYVDEEVCMEVLSNRGDLGSDLQPHSLSSRDQLSSAAAGVKM